jgi:hypothetical protein
MIQSILFSLLLSRPSDSDLVESMSCCLDHPNKLLDTLEMANYNCSILTPFGKQRCNRVYGSRVCKWANGGKCNKNECQRKPNYQMHFGKYVDVGMCEGLCKEDETSCGPNAYSLYTVPGTENDIAILKDCICDSCNAVPITTNLEINVDRCKGNCNDQKDVVCSAGVNDQFSNLNGLEPSNPSSALLSGMLSGCSAGVQPGFDFFADNRCFGHTFSECLNEGECPLRGANLQICMRAANVFLTNTDSLVLGINGVGLWGQGLPALNGGTWNQGEDMCLDLNLANLPGSGANILLDIQMAGHLDVMVQDDTAVDFVTLSLEYEKCQRCIPKQTTLSHFYSNEGVIDFMSAEDCDCVGIGGCERFDHFITYFEGTMFEKTVNVGQCLGKCSNNLRCNSVFGLTSLKAPEGVRNIKIVEKCDCGKITWNPNGIYIKE